VQNESRYSSSPNFLLVVCDDLGFGDLSLHGNPLCRTPNLDRLAGEGVSARRHYSGPLCAPARACLLTGRYNYRSRVVDTYCGRSLMDPEEETLGGLLRAGGYRTGLFGKWHLGDTPPFRPEDRGFDETLWHLGGGIGQPGDHPDNAGRESYFDPVLCRDGAFLRTEGYCTDIFTDRAVEFIRTHRDRPWFACVAFNAPHTPLQVDAAAAFALAARGATGDLAAYYAMVENIDANVGRLLAALEETRTAEKTVVVFTSDHGPDPHVRDGAGNAPFSAGLRGQKGSVHEGGVRVPCLWRGPGLARGAKVEEPTHAIDIVPTFLTMAGLSPDRPRPFDGKNLRLLLGGEGAAEWPDRPLFLQWHRGDTPVARRNAAVVNRHRKWISLSEAGPEELYDVSVDPGEENNLAGAETATVERLRGLYDTWFRDVSGAHGFAPVAIPVRVAAQPLRLTRQDWRVFGADGWDAETAARWVVRVEDPGEYEVEVGFDRAPEESGSVFLRAGQAVAAQPAVPGCARYVFCLALAGGEVEIAAGWQTHFAAASPMALQLKAVATGDTKHRKSDQ
jgi:arylsulfatase A-like enzyme